MKVKRISEMKEFEKDVNLDFTYRIDLQKDEIMTLLEVLADVDIAKVNISSLNQIKQKAENPKRIKRSWRKSEATKIATEARIKKVKEKIQNAVNILRMENKEVTAYQVSKASGVSFVTVKKYLSI